MLGIEDSAAGTRLQLTEWLNTTFASHLGSTLWVRQDGQTRVLDRRDVLSVTTLDSPRKATLQWKPNSGRTTTDPSVATKDLPFANSLGMKFVPVPITGGPTDGKTILFSVWDTRVQDYDVFAEETKRELLTPDFTQTPKHPAVMLTWDDGNAFCNWLTARERTAGLISAGEIYRLPTDHEWSCAVGIGEQEDAAKLPEEKHSKLGDVNPWGSGWPPPKGAGNYAGEELQPTIDARKYSNITRVIVGYNDGFVNTSPAGSFAANRFGLFDMGGNVWQWCADWLDQSKKRRVLRGGCWLNTGPIGLRSSDRYRYKASTPSHNVAVGFRCVLELEGARPADSSNADPARVRAIAMITRLNGNYASDPELPGNPIIQIHLVGKNADAAELRNLKGLTRLKLLDLNGCPVGDDGLAEIGDISSIEELGLWGSGPVTDKGFQYLAGMIHLKSLNIGYTGIETITGAGLVHLKDLTELEDLGLNILHKLEDRHLANVSGLIKLRALHLGFCTSITDAGLDHIVHLPKLHRLDLSETQVTDTGLQKLKTLTTLKELEIKKAKITDSGVAELQKALPDLKIVH